jgi:hypothetical protein
MKTGIELIAEERQEQIEKHGYNIEEDQHYEYDALLEAAKKLLNNDPEPPYAWSYKIWEHMINKPENERVIRAGAFLAAHLDWLNNRKPTD